AAAGGMANVNGVLQVEMRGQRRQVIGIVIHVVTVAHLSGPAMASAVMRYDAIAVLEEEQHLRVPVIGRQRPTMAEHDGLTSAPILVENLHAVLGCNRAHVTRSLTMFSVLGGYPIRRSISRHDRCFEAVRCQDARHSHPRRSASL